MGSAFGVEAGAGGFEGVFEIVVGFAFVGFEEELVFAGVERECEVAEGVDGGLVGAGFVAADVGDVEAGGVGEGVSGEACVFAGGDESFGEAGGVEWVRGDESPRVWWRLPATRKSACVNAMSTIESSSISTSSRAMPRAIANRCSSVSAR